MSAVPPKAEVKSGHQRHRPGYCGLMMRSQAFIKLALIRIGCALMSPRPDAGWRPLARSRAPPGCADSGLGIRACYRHNMASAYCALWTVFPKVISGLRKPIAIQAAISFNINLPE